MIWLVQSNLWREREFEGFIAALESNGVDYIVASVVPFSHELIPEPGRHDILAFGSTTLMKEALRRKWVPGIYWGPDLDCRTWVFKWPMHVLNYDHTICALGDVEHGEDLRERFFIRPCGDFKEFSGTIVSMGHFREWKERVLAQDSECGLNKNTPVLMTSVKRIFQEWRFFIVGREVSSYSTYRYEGELTFEPPVPEHVIKWVGERIKEWCPHRNFVMDVADTPKGLKIIEVNCFNGSGFYGCDMEKVVNDLKQNEAELEFRRMVTYLRRSKGTIR